jgi:dihydroxyacid dehydratase/phosphogluconate dehydratase
MGARAFDKSKLHSHHVTEGPSRAPWRPHDDAFGLSAEHILGPVARVRSSWSEDVTGNIAPMRPAQLAKRDGLIADGAPRQSLTTGDVTPRPGGKAHVGPAVGDGGDRNRAWLPVSDTTPARTLENVKSNRDQEVVDPVADPISATGSVVGLQGSRAPEGVIGEVVGMTRLQFRNRESDVIASDAEQGTRDLQLMEAGFGMRRNASMANPEAYPQACPEAYPQANSYESGTLRNWADQVGAVRAVAHASSRAEVVGYADI